MKTTEKTTYHLPNGLTVVRSDVGMPDYWTVYAGPGKVVYCGDAEGLLAWLDKHVWTPGLERSHR